MTRNSKYDAEYEKEVSKYPESLKNFQMLDQIHIEKVQIDGVRLEQ